MQPEVKAVHTLGLSPDFSDKVKINTCNKRNNGQSYLRCITLIRKEGGAALKITFINPDVGSQMAGVGKHFQ